MHQSLLPLMATVLVALAATDQADFSIKTTSHWNLSSLKLLERKDAILAVKRNKSETDFRFHLFVDGNVAYNASCNWDERWNAISISKEWVDLPYYSKGSHCQGSSLPEASRKLTGRSLVVTSQTPTDWQLIPLPIPGGESQRTSDGSTAIIDLPAREAVFLLCKPDDRLQANFELSLYTNDEPVGNLSFDNNLLYEWDMIAIYEDIIDQRYGEAVINIVNGSRTLQGRQIRVSSEAPIQWQMFSLPFEPVESKEQGSTFAFSLWLVIIPISFLYLLTLIAAGMYIRRLKESSRRPEGPATELVTALEIPSKIDQPTGGSEWNNEEAIYETVGNYEEPTQKNVRNYERYMPADSGDSQPVYANSGISQPIYANSGNSKNKPERPNRDKTVHGDMEDDEGYLKMGRVPIAPHDNLEKKFSFPHPTPRRNTEYHISRHQPHGIDNTGYMNPKHMSHNHPY